MHVLVTGAAGAIGSAIAREFHRSEPRATLSLVDIAGATSVAEETGAATFAWDLGQPHALEAQWHALVDTQGPVDVLVNCAGIMDMRSLAVTPWSDGLRLLDIDLVSPLRLMSLCAPGLVARRTGGIINVSSMAGVTPLRGAVFYGAAKAGLAMASEVARLELAAHGVRVLTVYPGPLRSALEKGARAQLSATLLRDLIPMGDPVVLARRIVAAFANDEARVVYPPLYELANAVPRLASWVTARFSPQPLA